MQRIVIQLLSSIAALAICGAAGATTIYKWVDAGGVTHYSDAAPEAIETTLIDVPGPRPDSDDGDRADSDYYSISKQWERMNRERLAREKLEVERDRIRAAQKAAEPRTVYVEDADDLRYVPIYRGYGFRKHHRRHWYRHPGPGIEPYRPASTLTGSWPTQ